jgi:DNA processing protein
MHIMNDFRRFELVLGDGEYPALLAQSPHPPDVLYGVGDPRSLEPGLAVVGSRRATPYGLAAARLLAGWAAEAGYPVVSGGAVGCDQAAHSAALDAGGHTVAVMAGGADVPYPRGAAKLLTRIADKGAVVSEHPWGAEPRRWSFRTRNRIIAGLCPVLLVLEASLPSGTFSTADYALDAGRTVAAVPGSIFAPECRGANRLLRNGATPITDASELADLLRSEIGEPPMAASPWEGPTDDESYDSLLAALRTNPMRPDDVARTLGLDIVTVARRLGALEARGVVSRYRDGRYGPG